MINGYTLLFTGLAFLMFYKGYTHKSPDSEKYPVVDAYSEFLKPTPTLANTEQKYGPGSTHFIRFR